MAFPFIKREKGGRSGRRVAVVVDDEPYLCQYVQVTLESAGFEVRTAHDGIDGLETIRAVRPQVILLDIKMPRMNGYEMLAALRADAQISQIPVVIMTSLTDGSDKSDDQWRKSLDVAGFLSKPFDSKELLAAVHQAVGD
jgi:CheY-like chemotaxis protein